MDPTRQKLLDRILKLLALANSTSFAAEADSARALAEELIARHRISPGEGVKEDRNQLISQSYTPWAKGAQWEYVIADALAHLLGCATYWHGDFEEYVLVGTVANLEALRFLIGEVGRQRIKAWLEYKNSPNGKDNLWAFAYAFARALNGKIENLLEGSAALRDETRRAKLWYQSTHQIHPESLISAPGASTAGRAAGNATSLHRGQFGQNYRQISHRRG